jgi:peroxiredoxin Q/BCP
MKRMMAVAPLLLASVLAAGVRVTADELKAGDPAPDFTLKASDGKTYSLSQLRGQTVVLAWFPKAFTAG